VLFDLIALALLAFGFAVLVVTFLWVARLLALRSHRRAARKLQQALSERAAEEPEPPEPESTEDSDAEAAAEERLATGRAVILGANLSLVLGLLACALFWLSPLFAVLSGAGLYYGGRCLWTAWRRFRVFVLRAFIGLTLSAISLGLHWLSLSGQLGAVLPFLVSP